MEAQRQGITDEELDDTMWATARPWKKQWESLGTDGSKWEEQELNDDDRQARLWRRRPSVRYPLKFSESPRVERVPGMSS